MKKRVVSMLLATCMLAVAVAGCGAIGAPQGATTEASVQADAQNESSAASEATSAEEGTVDAEAGKGAGGTPWMDSSIKDNYTADTPTDPADDFHFYANKDWFVETDIPDGYGSWAHYHERGLEVKKQCIELLKDTSIKGHDAELVRNLNSLILDWDSRNKLGISEIKGEYDKIAEAESIDDITKLLTDKETVYDYFEFINFGAMLGLNDPETYLALVDTPALTLGDSAEYSQRTENGENVYGYNKDLFAYMAQKYGMSEDEANKCFENAIDFETKLASKIYTTNEQYAEDFYEKVNNEMTFDEVTSYCKNFPLKDILTALGYKYDGKYLVTTPDYLTHLDELYTDENLEGIKSLLIVDDILSYAMALDKDTYDKRNEIRSKYFGTSGAVSDEEMAYNNVLSLLPDSMQIVYIEKYGSEEDKKKMTELCQEVIDTYRELLSENDWVSEETKNYAIEKLDNITIHSAYPDKFNDTSGINFDGCSFIGAIKEINLNKVKENIKLLGTKVDKEKWADGFAVTQCNAFYNPQDNSINMIIGMMGEPFFSSDMSKEELYASIAGCWVGHEVSHAFDSNGAQFDKDGQLRDWWNKDDKVEFQSRIEKMDNYLNSLVAFGDNHVVGGNIDTEMVADMTGLQCALRMASKVDNFDYKKFFITFAQVRAEISTYSTELNRLLQDPHPLNYLRTNVSVQQFDEFYEAFDVKEGDNMYLAPEDRLIVW
ncbi:M13 family peptidase [Butyrivibrio sp. X503]|uniref:M13-type metalloendopeptidase n=1 Tax=Butyrivibrio sp. X503 TaxID=2364878 RepID=UPI000EA98D04|nr:M13 family metallopeptidase [Butyrivibrio sp. X503]RKM55579.1 M13 family peptidase [Butyrivibrio sp. X503]